MSLYAQLFKWIISKLNVSLKGLDSFHSIGVLDIFGFENFQVCPCFSYPCLCTPLTSAVEQL
jgi:myosin heavy subunit